MAKTSLLLASYQSKKEGEIRTGAKLGKKKKWRMVTGRWGGGKKLRQGRNIATDTVFLRNHPKGGQVHNGCHYSKETLFEKEGGAGGMS